MLAKLFSNSHTLVFGEVLLNSLTLLTILSFGLLLLGLLGLLLFSRISLTSFLFKLRGEEGEDHLSRSMQLHI
jgi:hypothetical protein